MRLSIATLAIAAAIAALLAVAAPFALQIADGDKPTLSPDQETALLAATAETRAAAGKAADEGKKAKLAPAYIKLKFAPPTEGLQAMAARTAVEMGEAWGGTLELLIDELHPLSYDKPNVQSVSMSSLGSSATINSGGGDEFPSPTYCRFGPALTPAPPDAGNWVGAYFPYIVTVSAPSDTDSAVMWVWGGDFNDITGWYALPEGAIVVASNHATVDVQLSVSGLYLKRSRTATSYDDRQTMDWSDLSSIDKWYADETTTVTVTASGPGGINLSATGSLGYTPGAEVEIGSSYVLAASVSLNSAPTAATTYARISNINWGGTAVNAIPDLYNPGAAGGIPEAGISPWSRIWTTNAAYHVFGDAGGFAIEHLSGTNGDASVALTWGAPYLLTMTAVDRMFDTQGDQYDPRIEYSSVFQDWDYVGGTWVATPHTFTDTYSAVMAPTNYEYAHEWQTISTAAATVRATDDWRTANGEDVAGTAEGSDNERYNDQLAGICLPPIDATDCVSDPWWLSGIGITHQTELDLNDTEGQAKRASVWLGGVGVETDPLDNDKWTVTAGSIAPVVSRSWRSRYFMRMERLQEKKDDPEAEHLGDWPIMLKANLAIGATGDDPDWWEEPYLTVSGAGSTAMNGDYGEDDASAGGQQAYIKGASEFLRYDRSSSKWQLLDSSLTVMYQSVSLAGTYDVVGGASPGPAVSLYWPNEYGLYSCEIEDVYNWSNYRYLHLQLNAPVAGTVRLTITYKVPSVADSCYTGFLYRFGDWAEEFGGWEYSAAEYTLSWDIEVTEGSDWYLIDQYLNREGVSPIDARRIQVVTNVVFTLPANATESDQLWELQALKLVDDPGEPGRAEPATHFVPRFKPSWSWIDPSWDDDSEDAVHNEENWFGFGGIIDGKPCLQIDYGYNTSWGKVGNEKGLLYVQFAQHNPFSEATGRIDTAKSLSRWWNELTWQEGFEGTYPSDPAEGLHNQDADDGQVDGNLYWWDLRQSDETADWTDAPLALCVGSHTIAAGIAYDLRFYKYPRGAIHGILTNAACTVVVRDQGNAVDVYESEDSGPLVFIASLNTDEHGRYRFDAAREKGCSYMLDTGSDQATGLTVINRSYTTENPTLDTYTPVHPHLIDGYITDLHLAFVSSGSIYYRRRPTIVMPWETPRLVVAGDYPCLSIDQGAELVMAYEDQGSIRFRRSRDHGLTWGSTAVAVTGQYPIAFEANGIQYLVTYSSGVGQVIRRSQTWFSTLLPFGTATSALVCAAASCNAERLAAVKLDAGGRMIWAAVPSGTTLRHKGSYNDGETWVVL